MIRKVAQKSGQLFLRIMMKYWKSEYEAWANNYRWQREKGKEMNMKACEKKMEHYAGWLVAAQHVMPDREPELDIPEGAFS